MVQKEEQEATVKAQKTQEIADSAQKDLDEALPALVHHMTLSKCANFSLISYSFCVWSNFSTKARNHTIADSNNTECTYRNYEKNR